MPLGQGRNAGARARPGGGRPRLARALFVAAAGVLAAPLAVFALWSASHDDPYGGEPQAVVAADFTPASAASSQTAAAPPEPPAESDRRAITVIDGSTGQRQTVTVPVSAGDGPTAAGDDPDRLTAPATGRDRRAAPTTTPPPPQSVRPDAARGDPRLLEPSRHGLIPRIAADGLRPADAYAGRAPSGKPDAPAIAIVIGGLGIGRGATEDALARLPAAVTLAFSPYAADVATLAGRARAKGHETLLQIGMEPFDYPDNDPGPQTLLTSLDAAQNIDRMQWAMSRFQGYAGVTNAMGGRFTASDRALAPVLRETAKRGLFYVDDASAPRSLAGPLAEANNLPFARADVILDAVPAAADIDRALARLEQIALQRGVAVGHARALPVGIERIAHWAKAAESRGFVLAPVSAAISRARSS